MKNPSRPLGPRYGESAPKRVDWFRHHDKSCLPLWYPNSCHPRRRRSHFSLFLCSTDIKEILPVLCSPTCASVGCLRQKRRYVQSLAIFVHADMVTSKNKSLTYRKTNLTFLQIEGNSNSIKNFVLTKNVRVYYCT